MQGENDAYVVLTGDVGQCAENRLQPLGIVGIVVTVDGGQYIAAGLQGQLLHNGAVLAGEGGKVDAVVVHHIPAVAHPPFLAVEECGRALHKAFPSQIVHGGLGGGKANAGELVAHDAVNLFGHGHVKGAQPCLDMEHGYMYL